jgi:hypothetical protein
MWQPGVEARSRKTIDCGMAIFFTTNPVKCVGLISYANSSFNVLLGENWQSSGKNRAVSGRSLIGEDRPCATRVDCSLET